MKSQPITKEYKIDATGRTLGRVATEAATLLRGKNSVAFERHIAPKSKVIIENASKMKITQKKMDEKLYRHYSGYPGGLRTQNLKQVIARKGLAEPLKKAVRGMLPDNKLRPIMMKNLLITE